MSHKDDLVAELCLVFANSEAFQSAAYDDKAKSVLFWTTALRLVERKPFRDEYVQTRVLEFINQKLDRASDRLMDQIKERLMIAIEKLEEI